MHYGSDLSLVPGELESPDSKGIATSRTTLYNPSMKGESTPWTVVFGKLCSWKLAAQQWEAVLHDAYTHYVPYFAEKRTTHKALLQNNRKVTVGTSLSSSSVSYVKVFLEKARHQDLNQQSK